MSIRSVAILLALCTSTAMGWAEGPTTAPATAPATSPASLKTEQERMSYAVGLQMGMTLSGVELDMAALAAGMHDSGSGAKPQMSMDEIKASLMALQQKVMEQGKVAAAAEGLANQKAGDVFLAENAKKDGVKSTASGLQYKVLKSGKGKTPKATDIVSVNYTGTLINGKEFDSSKGTPVTFPVNRVIPGWTEALQLMKEGDTWQLAIPSKLAYDDRGAGEDIGPNSVLVFEVELVEVKAAAPTGALPPIPPPHP